MIDRVLSRKGLFIGVLAVGFILMTAAQALAIHPPTPKSGGEYIQGKGTKAEDFYLLSGRTGRYYDPGKAIPVGDFLVKPIAEYHRIWESNVFYDEHSETEDWIQLMSAGATAELPFDGGQHRLSGTYIADMEIFDEQDWLDHTDQTTQAALELNFVPFSLSVEDTYSRSQSRADSELTTRESRAENTIRGLLEVPFSKFFLETEVIDYDLDFRLPEFSIFDRHILSAFQRAGTDISPNMQLLFEYGYTNIHYKKVTNREGDANQFMVGVRGMMSERLKYQFWLGPQFRVYDEDIRPDFHDLVYRGAFQYDISEESSLIFRLERAPRESTYNGMSFYVENLLDLKLRHQIQENWFVHSRGIVRMTQYPRTNHGDGLWQTRRDLGWRAGVGLEYLMPNEMVSFNCEYFLIARDSNLSELDYTDSTLTFGVTARF